MLRRSVGTAGGFCVGTAGAAGILCFVFGGSDQAFPFSAYFQGEEMDAAAVIL